VNQLFEATGELGQNVVEHAGSPVGGFVAAQRYKAGAPDERIIVAVGEVGWGQGTGRDPLDPQRLGFEDDHSAAGGHDRRVQPAGYDLSGSVVMVDCTTLQASTPRSSTSWSRRCSLTGAVIA